MGLYTTTEPRCVDIFEFIHDQDAAAVVFTVANVPKFVLCTYKQFSGRAVSVQSSAPTRDMLERVIEITTARASKEANRLHKSTAWDWQKVRREALEAAVAEFGTTS